MGALKQKTIPNLDRLLGDIHDEPDWRYRFTITGRVVSMDYLGAGLVAYYEAGGRRRKYVLHRLGDDIPEGATFAAACQSLHLYEH